MRRCLSQKIYNVMSEALRVTVNYIKAECIMFLINFAVVLAGMIIAGLKWWSPLIALGVCLVDFLPVLGSGMVFIPWAVISIINGNAKMAVCVGVTYIVMVVARMIFEPIITGKAVGLSPLIT
ncbi:MAG: AI-2E family transporter, partial [Clostridiales bacterium]|nr:AI-2E family transporter [Clostridiales bacterium]